MENGSLIGVLAIFTVGAALVLAIVYFGYFLSNPTNRQSAKKALVDDETSSPQGQHDGGQLAPIKQRLDNSEASSHPDDPTRTQPAR